MVFFFLQKQDFIDCEFTMSHVRECRCVRRYQAHLCATGASGMPGVASRFFHNAHQFDSGHSRTGYIKQSCIVNRDRQTKEKVCQLRSGRRTSIWGNGGCRHANHVRSRAPARFFPERPERLTSQIWLPPGFCAPARRIPGHQKPAPIGNFSLFVPSLPLPPRLFSFSAEKKPNRSGCPSRRHHPVPCCGRRSASSSEGRPLSDDTPRPPPTLPPRPRRPPPRRSRVCPS